MERDIFYGSYTKFESKGIESNSAAERASKIKQGSEYNGNLKRIKMTKIAQTYSEKRASGGEKRQPIPERFSGDGSGPRRAFRRATWEICSFSFAQ